jgi:hypothetical protein
MSSERQIEANRRNAQKSTGPKTAKGKARSRFNAVTHGMTAELDFLPGEDASALRGRIDDWTADLRPHSQFERDLIERAARISWQLERVERAHVARLTANILKATDGANEQRENEARILGARLLGDSPAPDVSCPGIAGEPDIPARIVLRLESSAAGCRWLMDGWAELRSLLDQGPTWQSAAKLRAIRLLGRQPLDVFDHPEVGLVLLACHTIDSTGGELFHEIGDLLTRDQWKIVKDSLANQPFAWLRPRDQAEAREALIQIVTRAVGRLESIADAHRQREDRDAATARAALAFDGSRKGELLRNYESKCQRALMRALDDLVKAYRAGKAGRSVSAALSFGSSTKSVAAVEHGISQNEPNLVSSEDLEIESVAILEQGTSQNEPNLVSSEDLEIESVAILEQGTSQNEPNFVSDDDTEVSIKDNHKARIHFREKQTPWSRPKKRWRRCRRGHRRGPVDADRRRSKPGFITPRRRGWRSVSPVAKDGKVFARAVIP